ncbi:peptidoglycan bridge formation glycyltransferase FemA/FemB family protein [Pseudoclavibacter caeni]|jgi:lipid II:glycine glycyltransferase (peptidoglycan interpeptide bridge formation enzyme)|uniref:Peptidoglycan bridge formation glycyltransferase FemA/FemB family protein n=2 Tax=Pseudoclavibacter caeni TaxID=908846 RepID=A0A7C8FV76_9MICO|nr:peptidoglycan bridge formation glycyltransferase FemA/FemB family protein [Pseudoclavibacter caeni]
MMQSMTSSSASAGLRVSELTDRAAWDRLVDDHAGHPLQLWGWGAAKAHGGRWTPRHLVVTDDQGVAIGGAQVLVRRLPLPFRRLAYVPRGPFGPQERLGDIASAVTRWTSEHVGGVGITFEPDVDADVPFRVGGGRPQQGHVLIPRTLILDLRQTPDELMHAMAKKTRQYIRKSLREPIEYRRIVSDAELEQCLDLYDLTAQRAGFPLHDRAYYRTVQRELGEASPIYAAFHEGRPIAFLWPAASATTSFELYGGVDETGQRLRANYGLKWTAILDLQRRGVVRYDLNGLLNDGISTFKMGFASHEDLLHAGVDVPFSMWRYRAWVRALPAAQGAMRRVAGLLHR